MTFNRIAGGQHKADDGKGFLARPNRVELQVPASTSNLGPGFDAIGLALNLYNEFIFILLVLGMHIRLLAYNIKRIKAFLF